jgi:hypothetical protein
MLPEDVRKNRMNHYSGARAGRAASGKPLRSGLGGNDGVQTIMRRLISDLVSALTKTMPEIT